MQHAVVIPIYKIRPDWNEVISFKQCIKVLSKHPIYLITYRELDTTYYTNLLTQGGITYSLEYFDKSFFESIVGYNKLMLSKEFYKRFLSFKYILIHQLDVYVFRDDLDFWCNKGFDYVGAPWFEQYGFYEEGNHLWKVGNGGFSLRKTSSFFNIIKSKKPLLSVRELRMLQPVQKGFIKKVRRIVDIILQSFGRNNNMQHAINNWQENEDQFWSDCYNRSYPDIERPRCEEAIHFAFEKSPGYLYELNGRRLPFGCHAWEKYDYNTFWINFIQEKV